jgi:NAD(P)-dependent dehydrogenase (short-subunit alcohol dehydrogenase family)
MRNILVTGATDGLGRELVRRLAAGGDRVIVHGRSPDRIARTREEAGGTTESVVADLAQLSQVERLAGEVLDRFDRLDVLVNNAGVGSAGGRQESKDGIELCFAVNYLAGYHLTRRLLPLLIGSAPARVVNVASAGQHAIDFTDPMLTRAYTGGRAYSQSKLAQIMFTIDLAEELAGQEVTANALHPATYMDTTMVRQSGAPVMSTVAQGADATMRLIDLADLDGVTGQYFNGQRQSRADPQAYDRTARERLRRLSDELVKRALG